MAKFKVVTHKLTGASFGVLAIVGNDDVGNKGLGAVVFGAMFGLIGAGVGGVMGSQVPRDVWEPIPLVTP